MLVRARLTVAVLPFERWRTSLGGMRGSRQDAAEATRLAGDVQWAARRLPFETKCLPRAMALSWMLRKRGIAHALVFAVRPEQDRGAADDLHAWIDIGGKTILGELPGPWIETLRLG